MRLCLMIEGQEGVTWEQWRALACAAEGAGLEGLFRSDHYLSILRGAPAGSLDAWATLAALAAVHRADPARDDGLAGHVPAGRGAGEERGRASTTSRAAGSSSGSAPAGTRPSTRPTASPSGRPREALRRARPAARGDPPPVVARERGVAEAGAAAAPADHRRRLGEAAPVRAAVRFADEYNTVFPSLEDARERRRSSTTRPARRAASRSSSR